MSKKDFFDFKGVTEYYINQKNSEILKLEKKRNKYNENILKIKNALVKNKHLLEELQSNNDILKEEYNNLKKNLMQRGLIIDIINKNYHIKEWDNLYAVKNSKNYIVTNKQGEELLVFDSGFSHILHEVMGDTYFCSIVVTRVSEKNIKAQLRINKKAD